ncbi:hypothetical protein CcaverHIS002_0109230 [Cutaneotrichosporon cavernicola]|uniref:Arginase n=1 Tax=Cutaneotrichosporon cavernicola TaxID=279322 RepID=A0AA48I2I6_9TREE|nr:uncharacterized protein CcaverHIS019_0109150 [Cutaneotrichosporon cavernicola]BEI80394.1 hypothetical protein CcaverHIS002_0109230 [Cutaneotrichosporon cavernicola]BEI88197.1 hypothetical protein CcaverHIS019_0109150 [Cutaneotrichosporon cavernicola]BEI95968.1 hypothetical protein CcaverHIS631_0109170 [Cutaneotrichosporon cavernicola]BEJ03742.1 hypothetical protein CcaverHIS641_0109170 [Cutaneotrichosporon cavernicola]
MVNSTALLHYAARAGDHNDRAMAASPHLAAALASHLQTQPTVIGKASPSGPLNWDAELALALPDLKSLAASLDVGFNNKQHPVIVCSRCAVGLATLPVVARHVPDVLVVWFDAHGDLNTPATSGSGHIGGMALAGALGLWESGLGVGIKSVVLAGSRDIDAAEKPFIDGERVRLVSPGPGFVQELKAVVTGRKVYVHIDCDVLSPGQVPTNNKVPGGLSLVQLAEAAAAIAQVAEVVGVEVGELETGETEEETKVNAKVLVDTLGPMLK